MRRMVIILVVLLACLAWLDLPATKPGIRHIRAPAALQSVSLRDLIPASAILAVEVHGLERHWAEIRDTHALAGFQESILSCAGMEQGLVRLLAGDRAMMFLVPLDSQPWVSPSAILRPGKMNEAHELVSGMEGLSCTRARDALWVGPAGEERLLQNLARQEGARLGDILPMEGHESSLPPGGLVRGWVNPAACVELLRDSRLDAFPLPLRWSAAALRAALAAARYTEFRRDFVGGELVADALVVYDSSRLPVEFARLIDPVASPVILSPELPPNTLAVVAFRPEAQAWMPWSRYAAASDSRGPLRNLSFWLDEFQARYRRDLNQDLFRALGDHGWLLMIKSENVGSMGVVVVIETRDSATLEGMLMDLMSWMGEQIWLESLGTIMPRSWCERQRGNAAGGVMLHTPFSHVPGPNFQLVEGHLLVASDPQTMQAGRTWIDALRRSGTGVEQTSNGLPIHGSLEVRGAELARLIQATHLEQAAESRGCLLDAIAGLASNLEALRMDMRYEQDAIRIHGRIRFGRRAWLGSKWPRTDKQKEFSRQEWESLSSIVLSSSRIALTWGMVAALVHELRTIHPGT